MNPIFFIKSKETFFSFYLNRILGIFALFRIYARKRFVAELPCIKQKKKTRLLIMHSTLGAFCCVSFVGCFMMQSCEVNARISVTGLCKYRLRIMYLPVVFDTDYWLNSMKASEWWYISFFTLLNTCDILNHFSTNDLDISVNISRIIIRFTRKFHSMKQMKCSF